ncbi:sensor histidine kinase [Pseudonocardia parietis]|uniref:histidine kinase n=1 Tax=Pseudonocardia parietis TaxID=570936 RepID=A0ABS4VNR9_9PSEU|nr:ATP-binding protein [Pseudonocardia parietis]MBP2365567.1 signal transduction histidine kinase [Pseudonocardia parietis]
MIGPPAPPVLLVLDLVCSGLGLLFAVALLRAGGRSWPLRLLALASVAAAGAFHLRTAAVLEAVAGRPLGTVLYLLLVTVACAAAVGAMLLFPAPGPGRTGGAGGAAVAAGIVAVVLGVAGTATAGTATGCVLFCGFLLPTAGLVALRSRLRAGVTGRPRARIRLLLCALAATLVVAAALAVVTALLVALDRPGLRLGDPAGPPVALLFWFARVAPTAVAGAALLAAGTGPRVRAAQHLFGRALAVTLVAAVAGGTVAVLCNALTVAGTGPVGAATLAALPVAATFLPLYLWTEAFVDRLLHGSRPTPYTVLAGVTALSRATTTDGPDLDRVAEGVGRGLGATTCRLTVYRTGLRDRTYAWSAPGAPEVPRAPATTDGDTLVRVPVRQGDEQLGEIAVDRDAVQGLRGEWRNLLPDIADSLGVVLHANRSAIELERQLRAALAHGERIAAARRDAVARMDTERRRIERDLHDGAQHHLVSLGLSLGLVEHLVSAGQPEQARDRLDELLRRVDGAESVLAETVGGVSSAVLAEQGLVAVLRDTLAASEPPVTIEHDGVPPDRRYPDEIGDTAYFCCLEAVNNARKHAAGAPVTVRITEQDATLTMAVRDEGPGFVPDPGPGTPPTRGRGLRNLTVRLGAVGGTVAVRSAPGAGTTVLWSLPLPAGWAPDDPVPPAPPAPAPAGVREQVRELVGTAAQVYAGTGHAPALARAAALLDRASGGADNDGVLAARSALGTLEEVLRAAQPGPPEAEHLRYGVERLRARAHELVESELAEALRRPGAALPGDLRASAERLLGRLGSGSRARLGLPADAGPDDVRRAAEHELARWQRLAGNPASTGAVRNAAPVLVRTCERLLAERPADPSPGPGARRGLTPR